MSVLLGTSRSFHRIDLLIRILLCAGSVREIRVVTRRHCGASHEERSALLPLTSRVKRHGVTSGSLRKRNCGR